jgi:hypothetical protein
MITINQTQSVSHPALAFSGIAASGNGQIQYASIQQEIGYDFYTSTDYGASWGPLSGTSPGLSGRYTSIGCDSTGTIIYVPWQGGAFYKSTNSGSTWTNISTTLGNGEGGENIIYVGVDSTGTKLIVASSYYIYISTNSGTTWTSSGLFSGQIAGVACSRDFSVRYAIIGNDIYKSTNPSNTTWTILPGNVTRSWFAITCDTAGQKVFAVDNARNLYAFVSGKAINVGSSTQYGFIASYSSGAGLASIGATNFETYSITYTPPPCFKDDTKILCYKDGAETYVKVQDIRKGDLVKTLKDGYVPVNMIGTTKIYNSGDSLRGDNKLYRCSTSKYSSLFEDLIMTGTHSILVDTLKEEEREKIIEIVGRIFVTDGKYRLFACVDPRAEPYEVEGVFRIWHLALDHDNYMINFGIFANGLLVETCSQRYIKEYSGMTLIE